MNAQPLDQLLDVLADSTGVNDDEDRAAFRRTAEVLRDRVAGGTVVPVVLVRGPDADALAEAVANLQIDVDELWDLATIGDHLVDLLAVLRARAGSDPAGATPCEVTR